MCFHRFGIGLAGLVVPSLGVQGAVHQQVGIVRGQGFALFFGLARHHRCAQHQVGHHQRFGRVIKGQHIGGVVFASVRFVELAPLVFAHDAHRHLGVGVQRMANGADHLVAWQRCAVPRGVGNVAKLQRQAQVVQALVHAALPRLS